MSSEEIISIEKNKIVSSEFTFYCFSFTEYSGALPGVPTSYAALLRIKKSSSSSLFGSKTRPRYSSPSLGTLSVSSPNWQGEPSQCFVESQGLDWLLKLLTPFLAPPETQGLGWLPGHSGVFLAPSGSAAVHAPSHSESY